MLKLESARTKNGPDEGPLVIPFGAGQLIKPARPQQTQNCARLYRG